MRLLMLLLCAAGCATTTSSPDDRVERAGPRASDFVPLAVGNAWTYRVTPGQEALKVEIVSKDDKGFFVDSQGERRAPRTDGVFDGHRFVLKEPIAPGTEWMAVVQEQRDQPGVVEQYRIVSTGEPCTAPAGEWRGCVVVEGTQQVKAPDGKPATLVGRWTYAKGVGMVRFESEARMEGRPPTKALEYVLVDYLVAQGG